MLRPPSLPRASSAAALARVSILVFAAAVSVDARPGSDEKANVPDLILHGGKIVTVDGDFSVAEALAIRGDTIVRTGSDGDVLSIRGDGTRVIDLEGKTVLPGLVDSHVHATSACMTEFDHEIPAMESIADVLRYIEHRAALLDDGEWIVVRQVFITRLEERRYPTREELDRAAPKNPVLFSTGPDASVNSLALELSGIDRDFRITDGRPGKIERDPTTGDPTGILRSATRLIRAPETGKQPTKEDRRSRLRELLLDYNANGITAVADRNASASAADLYRELLERGELSTRVFLSRGVDGAQPAEDAVAAIRAIAHEPLAMTKDPRLFIGGIKVFLDGGMLTGSAYMRKPWGVSEIYSIDDPEYRGLRFIEQEPLVAMVRAAVENGLQFTAHSVGDGAVHALLDAYAEVARTLPIRATHPCITHANFMSAEAVREMKRLGVVADIQPAWLWLDTRTLHVQFGDERLRWFQPLRTLFESGVIVGGGSDHMQKIGARRAVNPYDPFLGMWVTMTRRAKGFDGELWPEEALDRRRAIEFYTRNNAYILRLEDKIGSLEPGKLADFCIIDRDILGCPVDDVRDTRVIETWLGGERVWKRKE